MLKIFSKMDVPQLPRAKKEMLYLLMASVFPIINIVIHYDRYGIFFLLLNFIVFFLILGKVIAIKIIPYIYIKNNTLYIYKNMLRKPDKIPIEQIKEVKVFIGTWLFKGTSKLIFKLQNGDKLDYTMFSYSKDEPNHVVKKFFVTDAKIVNISVL